MAHKIVLTTIGSLGDLHPFLAIGQALKAKGARPLMAVPDAHVSKAEGAGLDAIGVVPSIEAIAERHGISTAKFTRNTIKNSPSIAQKVLLPSFNESYDRLEPVARDASLIAGSSFMFAGQAVAEKHGLPFASMVLQPLAFLSDYDPPLLWEFPVHAFAPKYSWQVAWNKVANFVLRFEVHRRYTFTLNRARRAKGLGPIKGSPMFGSSPYSSLTIGMYSEVLGAVQKDFPPNTTLVGFPQFDSDSGAHHGLSDELETFLNAGEPPIVFTLGSFAVHAPGDFYANSREAARKLGRRSVLLTGMEDTSLNAPDCLVVRYAPHSALFPRAAVVVHHGGVGTTGQALRSGRPQLVVPFFGDQPDNAARVKRLGAGLSIRHSRYSVARAVDLLSRLLKEPGFEETAQRAHDKVRAEHAADVAADILIGLAERGCGKDARH